MLRTLLALLCFFPLFLSAQIWTEDFDGANTTNPPAFDMSCTMDNNDYFGLVCENGGSCSNPVRSDFVYGAASGTFFGVRDMDSAPGCSVDLAGELLSFTDIDITSCGGATNVLYLCFTVAETRNMDGANGSEYSNSNMREDTWDAASYVFVRAGVDGANLTDVTAIQAFTNSDTRPGIDVNCDGRADDPGEPEVTATFTNYCFELPTTGSALDLEFTFGELNTQGEDIAIDDISVHCTTDPGTLPGTLLDACTPFVSGAGPIYLEDFDGSASTPFTIDPACSRVNSNDYFGVVCLDGGPCGGDNINSNYTYNNADGSFFGARDADNACGGPPGGFLSVAGIDITSCTNMVYLCMDFAESASAVEQSNAGVFDSWDGSSNLYVYTTFDDGTELRVTGLQSSNGTDSPPAFDTGCNEGGGEGPVINETFTKYCFALAPPPGATTVDIRIEVDSINTVGEDIAIDNIAVYCANDASEVPGTEVVSCNDAVLPVELTEFRGRTLSKGASLLEWTTASELDNDYFDVEYSTDGATFAPIGRVTGAVEASSVNEYTFEHANPTGSVHYYRLRQVDFDGTTAFSKVVTLRSEVAQAAVSLYPNPATDRMQYRGPAGELTIYNGFGQVVAVPVAGNDIDLSSLRPGAYLLEVRTPTGERSVQRFVKR
ncbi:T9SS type A sorting domain-containing protein [Lewinella sp. 4G2]|uniref:T9SS type A sorting domain-containing protein n=1 Tax=Lewinella sp. 4G2 TaxID=1803372 RepID=UPI0007B4A2C3|nr:T9SS type A sorting domain-containing protein [Lewinella sp. 4G2]OAV44031.1 hypothetical protein A3850_005760 [Lewinella sp. 4G2]